jgi:hypothetical protein
MANGDAKPKAASTPQPKEAWAPRRKAGEARGAYLKRFYSAQRENAEETGDQATVNKIYGKLGRKSLVGARRGDNSLDVDANKTDKMALAAVPAIAAGGRLGLGMMARGGARAAASEGATGARAIASKGAQKALPSGVRTATRVAKPAAKAGTRKLPGQVNRLPARGAQKALPGSRTMAPMKRAAGTPMKAATSRGAASRTQPSRAVNAKKTPAMMASDKKRKASKR